MYGKYAAQKNSRGDHGLYQTNSDDDNEISGARNVGSVKEDPTAVSTHGGATCDIESIIETLPATAEGLCYVKSQWSLSTFKA